MILTEEITTDTLVIGSGIAGLSFALQIAQYRNVTLITKDVLTESNTWYAQGGIASVASEKDSFLSHIQDTIKAGNGLCKKSAVETVIKEGPDAIQNLIKWNVRFTHDMRNTLHYDLTQEGGHSHRRIFHKDDITGQEIQNKLVTKARRAKNIRIYEHHMAVNLITRNNTCYGAYVLDIKKGSVITFKASAVVLATGGLGKVYMYTSNPDIASGDGVALAYRAGAVISNMEFVQFHPTCLYHPEAKSFLISESMRGEGARLLLPNGKTFMRKYHALGDLAPRDSVARAIDFEIKKRGIECVYLDITHKSKKWIMQRFPNIYGKCLSLGIDISKEKIPVVPAAHYACGGVQTDLHGRTNIKNLFSIGEAACTGLHGSNRLASNSLLESVVFAKHTAEFLKYNFSKTIFPRIKKWDIGSAVDSSEVIMINHNWYEIRRLMWNYVGIVRSNKRLARAKRRIDLLQKEILEYYWNFTITAPLLELRNLATVAEIIIRSAQKRKESRGLHYSLDYPNHRTKAKNTILKQKK